MKKEEALQKIEELKKFVEELDKKEVEKNLAEIKEYDRLFNLNINSHWAGTILKEEDEGEGYCGEIVSSHKASLYLADVFGDWLDQDGRKVNGYLYYKPNAKLC